MIPQELIKEIRRVEILTRRMLDESFAGAYQSVFKGRGMEFTEVREYMPGDDVRTIDWNVTARMGRPYVKRFVEERELTVMLMVDASGSERFGTQGKFKGELAVRLCALLAFTAIKNNDRVGLIIFTDRIEKFVAPKTGRTHVLRVIRELLAFEPDEAHRATDLQMVLGFVTRMLKRRSVLFLVSDFIGTGYERALEIANRKHDLIAVSVADPREIALPRVGLIDLEDAETGEVVTIDTFDEGSRQAFFKLNLDARRALENKLRRSNVDSIPIMTDAPRLLEPVQGFFRKRTRRNR
ncbi:MAG: DUF58 domain-containing protein [Candidatus Alcyoniella australis]|nr:DUF58 domain-containing protein [Candidatus Alcyoniella australis]